MTRRGRREAERGMQVGQVRGMQVEQVRGMQAWEAHGRVPPRRSEQCPHRSPRQRTRERDQLCNARAGSCHQARQRSKTL